MCVVGAPTSIPPSPQHLPFPFPFLRSVIEFVNQFNAGQVSHQKRSARAVPREENTLRPVMEITGKKKGRGRRIGWFFYHLFRILQTRTRAQNSFPAPTSAIQVV